MNKFIHNHYTKLSQQPDAIGEQLDKNAKCLALCSSYLTGISSLLNQTIVMYDAIRLTIERYVSSNRFQKEFELEGACKYMGNLVELIWRFESCIMEPTRLDLDTDFRKIENFKIIMEKVNDKESNFIDFTKVIEMIDKFKTKTKYASDYMTFVFNKKSSYTIKDDYINIFDMIINNTEYFRDMFFNRISILIHEAKLQYFGVNSYMDTFAMFVTNSVFNDICFSVFDKFNNLLKSAKQIMPKNA